MCSVLTVTKTNNIILSLPLRAALYTVSRRYSVALFFYIIRESYQIYGRKTFLRTLWSGSVYCYDFIISEQMPRKDIKARTSKDNETFATFIVLANDRRHFSLSIFYSDRCAFFPSFFSFYDRTSLYFRTHVGRRLSCRVFIVFTTNIFFSGGESRQITSHPVVATELCFAHGRCAIMSAGDTRKIW